MNETLLEVTDFESGLKKLIKNIDSISANVNLFSVIAEKNINKQ